VGARALRGVGQSDVLLRKRLTRYNASFNEAYWRAIKQARARYRREFGYNLIP
jgi:hypothetical protein